MPKKAADMSEKIKMPSSIDAEKTQVEVRPDYAVSFRSDYSNYAAISHTGSELCIDFCTILPPHRIDLEKKVVLAPVVVRILIPPALVEGLINALKIELKKYREDLKQKSITLLVEKKTTGKDDIKK